MIGRPSRSLTPWLLFLVASFAHAVDVAGNYSLTIQPSWQGHIKPGVISEVAVRFVAPHGGEARLTLRSSRSPIYREFQFEPGVPLTLFLPLAHDSVEPASVEVHVADHLAVRKEIKLQILPPAAIVVARVNGQTPSRWQMPQLPQGRANVLDITASELPHRGQHYALLAALMLSGSALVDMAPLQRQALSDFIGGCGRLYLSEVPVTAENTLRSEAGCNSRNVLVVRPGKDERLLSATIDELPGAATLRRLGPAGSGDVQRSLLVFLAAYVLLLLVMARSANSPLSLMVLPLLATVLALLGWSLATAASRTSSWAEMDSGDAVARFSGLLHLEGMSRATEKIALPAVLGRPLPTEGEHPMELVYERDTDNIELQVETQWLSRQEFVFAGVVPGLPLDVLCHADGVRVINRSGTSSPAGVLAWQGQRYSVPMLATGQAWAQPAHPEPWGDTPEEQLLRQRASTGGGWLLVPFPVESLQMLAGEAGSSGWLLIRGVADV